MSLDEEIIRPPSNYTSAEDVEIERQNTERFLVRPDGTPRESERAEQRLVMRQRNYIVARGIVVRRRRYRPAGVRTEAPDLGGLLFFARERKPLNRNFFNTHVWRPALEVAGVPAGRRNGMHALRHACASTWLDRGVNIKAVSEYLGHADPGFTLRIYTHVRPSSDD